MEFIHRPKSKILKILKKLKSQRFGSWLCFHPPFTWGGKQSQLPKRCDFNFFNIFNILLFGRWIKSANPSPQNITNRRQNLLELLSLSCSQSFVTDNHQCILKYYVNKWQTAANLSVGIHTYVRARAFLYLYIYICMESNSVITSWKGLNILCRYKRVLL
jgi:hypothetical protein